MSVQRGNYKKKGQKYQNTTAFKNNLHDNSSKIKALNSMVISEVCKRCMDIIQWKIKYKKYKPLTQPKKCTKCSQKAVKKAYYIICSKCAKEMGICAKCGERREIIHENSLTASEAASHQSKLEAELRLMPERKRRAFYRNQMKGEFEEDSDSMDESEEDPEDFAAGDDKVEEKGDEDQEEEDAENVLEIDVQKMTITRESGRREELCSNDVIR